MPNRHGQKYVIDRRAKINRGTKRMPTRPGDSRNDINLKFGLSEEIR